MPPTRTPLALEALSSRILTALDNSRDQVLANHIQPTDRAILDAVKSPHDPDQWAILARCLSAAALAAATHCQTIRIARRA